MAENKKPVAKKTSASRPKSKAKSAEQVVIDGTSYPLNELSDAAKVQLNNLSVTEARITELETELTIARTARAVYADNLKHALVVVKGTRH
ncbi:hypothetical protein GCM10011297_30220 [Bacterioplanes sanyensis]|uniref:DUF6447 family protein n=1 Tax=Bacterioplanes sanyensis TaxID=1249553 RepID=UPI00167B69AE|nr:DUF6447 family protein [Bacterioplanes sanyensis]GGY55422.1 hypothetical protein GCM10011297_30220 [Bacterioplanes sanyensis]